MATVKADISSAASAMALDPAAAKASADAFAGPYHELLGFLPPRVEARLSLTGLLDKKIVEMQEEMRSHAMDTPHLDPKTVQLMLFGMLLMDGNDAATTHAIASRRCGASWDELQAVISLCFLFRGLPAANRGADTLANVAMRESAAAK